MRSSLISLQRNKEVDTSIYSEEGNITKLKAGNCSAIFSGSALPPALSTARDRTNVNTDLSEATYNASVQHVSSTGGSRDLEWHT